MTVKNHPVNASALSKKYKCDVNRLIRLWKKGKSDVEISRSLGIDTLKILQLRQEITHLYEKDRQKRLKKKFATNFHP